jgi:hypothetical protein
MLLVHSLSYFLLYLLFSLLLLIVGELYFYETVFVKMRRFSKHYPRLNRPFLKDPLMARKDMIFRMSKSMGHHLTGKHLVFSSIVVMPHIFYILDQILIPFIIGISYLIGHLDLLKPSFALDLLLTDNLRAL